MDDGIAFLIVAVEQRAGATYVIGRCLTGPIHVGSVFTRIYSLSNQRIPDGYAPAVRSGDRSVTLHVTEVLAYGHSLTTISTGMTAKVALAGLGTEFVRSDQVLGVPPTNQT